MAEPGTKHLTDLLAAALDRNPAGEAVRCRGRSMTYAELDAASNGLARALMDAGAGPEERVAIHLPKSVEAVVAVWGVLKSGAAYVPIDPGSPPYRVESLAADCLPVAVITSGDALRAFTILPPGSVRLFVLTGGISGLPEAPGPVRRFDDVIGLAAGTVPPVSTDDLAYVLYTSGSTGTPRGVMLTHRGALAFVRWAAEEVGVAPNDRLANHAPLQFDLSVFDLFAAAAGAACVTLVPEEAAFLGGELLRFVQTERPSVWYSVPSALRLVVRAAEGSGLAAPLGSLRAVVFAGEVYPTPELRRLRAAVPGARLWNWYGPTETNVCLSHEVRRLPQGDPPLPIGRPCSGDGALLRFPGRSDRSVDEPPVAGRLCVYGPTVMRGYWRDPEATAAVLAEEDDRLVYDTGDLARLRPDGEFQFVGRSDEQVKTRGYRVELGEVEAAIGSHPGVSEAAVVASPHPEWGTELVACVVPADPSSAGLSRDAVARDVRRHLAERLPRSMLPSRIEVVASLPRTPNGKVDRRRILNDVQAR